MPDHISCPGEDAQQKWNARYQQASTTPQPTQVLRNNQHLLPSAGRALDLACGLGGNALLLAEHGLDTWAWDISDRAIDGVLQAARQRKLSLRAEVRDVVAAPPIPNSFDVIVVSHFLDRSLAPVLIEALRPEGLLFYQTFTRTAVGDVGPRQPAYRLSDQELLQLFRSLSIVVYREEGRIGDLTRGLRNEAMLVGQGRVPPGCG
jgi:SAM-dependent methyltransferase